MGVQGLQSFLKNNIHLVAQQIDVCNTSLVFDGSNLFCQIFTDSCINKNYKNTRNDIYGGDLVMYADLIKEFFANLQKCKITPILVYDGSVIGKQATSKEVLLKDDETHRRGLKKFYEVKNVSESEINNTNNINVFLPKCFNRIFKNIAKDLGIESIQAAYEADPHIARIANDLNCPVFTSDSDFLIYPLKRGFIMYDFFDYKNVKVLNNGKNFAITSYIISQKSFLKNLPGLRIENMPLMSILLGNDFTEVGTFSKFLSYLCNVAPDSEFREDSFKHRKIASVLSWLRGKTFDEALELMLERAYHTKSRDNLRAHIKMLFNNYRVETDDDLSGELATYYPDYMDCRGDVLPEHRAPFYYSKLFENGSMSANLLDIICHNTNYNYAAIDDFQLISSSYVKYRPFSVCVTLLRPKSYFGLTTYKRQIQANQDALRLFDRLDGEYKELLIKPIDYLDGFGSIEHMNAYSIISVMPEIKRNILLATFRFTINEANLMNETLSHVFNQDYAQEATLCFMLVKYISLETKSRPKPQFVEALMLTFFYYAALKQQLKPETFEDTLYGSFLLKLRPHTFTMNDINYKPSVGLFRRIMHFISQLGLAYNAYAMLNGLLEFVYYQPRVERFYNGVLIFRLTKLLRQGQLNMQSLCGQMTTLYDICNSVKLMVDCNE